MEKPVLSADFTIDDIHKLREYNYYITKEMPMQDALNYYNMKGMDFQKKVEHGRRANASGEMV